MKKNFLLLAVILVVALSSFAIGEQEYEFKIKQKDLDFIANTLAGVKQTLATSDVSTKQSLQIFNNIDSVQRIFQKSLNKPVAVDSTTTKKKKK